MATAVGEEIEADRRFVLGLFTMGHLANDWAAGSVLLIAPAVATAFGLGAPEVGLLLFFHSAAGALVFIPAGLLADRVSRRGPLLSLTFVWVTLGYFGASFAKNYWTLVLLLAVAVLGDAAWHPIATGDLVQRYPTRRAHVLGVHTMGGTIGAEVLGPVGVGLLLTVTDWRNALRISVIPAALMCVIFVVLVRRLGETKVRVDAPRSRHGMLAPWSNRQGALFITSIVLYNMAQVAVLSMTPLFLQRELGYSPLTTGVVIAGMLTLGSVLQPQIGRLSDAAGRKPSILVGTTIGAVAAGMAGVLNPGVMSVAALVVAMVVFTAIRSVILAAAVEIGQGRESTNLALAFTLMDGVGGLGALLAGLAGRNDLTHAFLLACGLATAAAMLSGRLQLDAPRDLELLESEDFDGSTT